LKASSPSSVIGRTSQGDCRTSHKQEPGGTGAEADHGMVKQQQPGSPVALGNMREFRPSVDPGD
jgi:hypothetical protein